MNIARWSASLLLMAAGCAGMPAENIPQLGAIPTPEVLSVLSTRTRATRSVSGEAAITLTRPDGQSVQLDGAVVLQLPSRARVRAWKFGQAVFDLTFTPAGVWIFSGQTGAPPAGAGDAIAQWVRLLGSDFSDWQVATDGADHLVLQRKADGGTLSCVVDRRTATARQFRFVDAQNKNRFQMLLSHYTVVNGIAWPAEVRVRSDAGSVLIDWRDVQINGDVPAAAFKPPARAMRVAGGTS